MSYRPVTSHREVITPDGVRLALRENGPADAPVILFVHGFPDDATVWDRVTDLLAGDFRTVSYDVRGAGGSDRPRGTQPYRLDTLVADLATVIDAVSPDRPVHVVAHDWGSIQVWHALTQPETPRVASYISISGPELRQARRWMRAQLRSRQTIGRGLRQMAGSSYIAFFKTPLLPEALSRIGLVPAIIRTDRSRRGHPVRHEDVRDGLGLYRANLRILPRLSRRSGVRRQRLAVRVPVMVVAPTRDRYVTAPLQSEVAEIAPDLRLRTIRAGHWVPLSHPEEVAQHVREFVSP